MQDIIKNPCASSISGFNCRVSGYSYLDTFQYPHERSDGDRHGGWDLADRMISEGRIFYVHNFHKLECERGFAFPYGGTWVCNECGGNRLDQEWWKIRVFKDGNAWCCIGIGFVNLQESDNYDFGDTKEEAINNYGRKMLAIKSKVQP